MIELTIPGRGVIRIQHLVCDVNGTLALDGCLIEGVAQAIAVSGIDHLVVTAERAAERSIDARFVVGDGARAVPGFFDLVVAGFLAMDLVTSR